jgi:catechol 2,3-dioxygenase-like lactoylglutathione lyase family enzyme
MAALGYATVGSNNLEKAKAFYDALFGPAGITPVFEHPTGGRIYGKAGGITFGVLGPYDGKPATVGNGGMIAFRCDSAAAVNDFHARALKLGGADEGAPGYRAPKMYFSYFRDLDGNKLCAYALEA